jgi:hypothetical protein
MDKLLKLADLFEKSTQDVFGDISWKAEAKNLHHIAGRILYKSDKARDNNASIKLRRAGELVLQASDILKSM